jgi:hypothetical protein
MRKEMEATLTATDAELVVLLQLLHRAVLHSGMDVADAAVFWKAKVTAARTSLGSTKANGADAHANPLQN